MEVTKGRPVSVPRDTSIFGIHFACRRYDSGYNSTLLSNGGCQPEFLLISLKISANFNQLIVHYVRTFKSHDIYKVMVVWVAKLAIPGDFGRNRVARSGHKGE